MFLNAGIEAGVVLKYIHNSTYHKLSILQRKQNKDETHWSIHTRRLLKCIADSVANYDS